MVQDFKVEVQNLTLPSNVKTEMEIVSNLVAFLEYHKDANIKACY